MSHCLKYRRVKPQATVSGNLPAHCFQCMQRLDQYPKDRTRHIRQKLLRVLHSHHQFGNMSRTLRNDNSKLSKMASQGIDDLRSLPHEKIACPEYNGCCLTDFAFNSDETHGRAQCCLTDRLSIRSIILVPLYEWLHIRWRYQPNRMAQIANFPTPVVAAGACLQGIRGVMEELKGTAILNVCLSENLPSRHVS